MRIRKIKNTKAELTTKEIIEFILAAACIFLLIFLMVKILNIGYDKDKETAKSYLDMLKAAVAEADKGGTGEFLIYLEPVDSSGKAAFAAVYFGDKRTIDIIDKTVDKSFLGGTTVSQKKWVLTQIPKNTFCICYAKDGKYSCSNCMDLSSPVFLVDGSGYYEAPWVFLKDEKMYIKKYNGYYYAADSAKKIDDTLKKQQVRETQVLAFQNAPTITTDEYLSDAKLFWLSFSSKPTIFFKFDSGWQWCAADEKSCMTTAAPWSKVSETKNSFLNVDITSDTFTKDYTSLFSDLSDADLSKGKAILFQRGASFYLTSDVTSKTQSYLSPEQGKIYTIRIYNSNVFECEIKLRFNGGWEWYGTTMDKWTSVSQQQTDKVQSTNPNGITTTNYDKISGPTCIKIASDLVGKSFEDGRSIIGGYNSVSISN